MRAINKNVLATTNTAEKFTDTILIHFGLVRSRKCCDDAATEANMLNEAKKIVIQSTQIN